MVSNSQQFERIRRRKATTNGKHNKRDRRRLGTQVFAVHPEGYDVNAADAKKPEAPKAALAAPKKKKAVKAPSAKKPAAPKKDAAAKDAPKKA